MLGVLIAVRMALLEARRTVPLLLLDTQTFATLANRLAALVGVALSVSARIALLSAHAARDKFCARHPRIFSDRGK